MHAHCVPGLSFIIRSVCAVCACAAHILVLADLSWRRRWDRRSLISPWWMNEWWMNEMMNECDNEWMNDLIVELAPPSPPVALLGSGAMWHTGISSYPVESTCRSLPQHSCSFDACGHPPTPCHPDGSFAFCPLSLLCVRLLAPAGGSPSLVHVHCVADLVDRLPVTPPPLSWGGAS